MSLRPFADQLARVLATATPAAPVTVPLAAARGLVLAEDVAARCDLPGFANSAMDGYAVRCADVTAIPVTLRVIADVPAGSSLDPALAPGECARIMTGAPVPADADAVVPFEHTDLGTRVNAAPPAKITVQQAPKLGANIRGAGEDIRCGDPVARAGTRISARDIAACAAAGVTTVAAMPRPRVAVLSTGSELRASGPLARGELYDSNRPMLRALVEAAGAELTGDWHVDDDGAELLHVLADAATNTDVVVTTGGVSVGAFDVVRLQLAESGWDVEFAKIAMQPGKPQGFGRAPSGALLFALPGNPVSAFVSFTAFVLPALTRLAGDSADPHRPRTARAGAGWRSPEGRMQFMPVRWRDGAVVPAHDGGSGSHLVARLAGAEALAVVPAQAVAVAPGDALEIWEVLS